MGIREASLRRVRDHEAATPKDDAEEPPKRAERIRIGRPAQTQPDRGVIGLLPAAVAEQPPRITQQRQFVETDGLRYPAMGFATGGHTLLPEGSDADRPYTMICRSVWKNAAAARNPLEPAPEKEKPAHHDFFLDESRGRGDSYTD